MSKVEIFVSDKCPHCAKLIEKYQENPDEFDGMDFYNINENMMNLKRFLKYRDTLEGYEDIKAKGKVGVPSKVIDETKVEFFDQV